MRSLWSLAVWSLMSCATTPAREAPPRQGAMKQAAEEADRVAVAARQAVLDAERSCEPLRDQTVSYVEERSVGQHLAAQVLEKNGKPASDEAIRYVAVVGRNLARYSARPDIGWTFVVIDNDAPRTFSAPGGFVFVTTGALAKMSNEAQLAGALAFEIANVVSKRDIDAYARARHRQCLSVKTAAAIMQTNLPSSQAADAVRFARSFENYDLDRSDESFTSFIMNATLQMMLLAGGADAQLAADRGALQLVSFAGYDAKEYETYLQQLPADDSFGHAPIAARVEKLKALREGELAPFAVGTAKPALKVTK